MVGHRRDFAARFARLRATGQSGRSIAAVLGILSTIRDGVQCGEIVLPKVMQRMVKNKTGPIAALGAEMERFPPRNICTLESAGQSAMAGSRKPERKDRVE